MSRVSRRNTSIEKIVFSFLRKNRLHYRSNVKALPGSPDVVLINRRVIIFVHGCFWHGHNNCKLAKIPSTNKNYWDNKINQNIERDKRKINELKILGWKIFIIWQCQINTVDKSIKRLNLLLRQLTQ
ncbi:MAG: DNA mismatch endonuclease Vsr [Ignavibacteriae bacterium]|nr:DNA mismatch endonuclease Vsr [Ignavibacteriota bacterium]